MKKKEKAPRVYVTIGSPGSGKRVWIRKKVSALNERKERILSKYDLETDDFNEKMAFQEEQRRLGVWVVNEKKILKMLYGASFKRERCVQNTYTDVIKGIVFSVLRTGRTVIIEGEFIDVNSRREMLSTVMSFNHATRGVRYEVVACKFPISLEFCLRNKVKKGLSKIKWRKIISKYVKRYQAPTKLEGFSRIIRIK